MAANASQEETGELRARLAGVARSLGDLRFVPGTAAERDWAGRFNFRNILYNLVPTVLLLGIPAYLVYATVREHEFLGSAADALTLGAIAILAACWVQGVLIERVLARGGARALLDVENGLAIRTGAFVQGHFLSICEELAREAGTVLDDVESAREATST